MSEACKKHDRPCAPCTNCGTELYEKFWGNGGWAKTDKVTNEGHGQDECIKVLQADLNRLTQAVLASQTTNSSNSSLIGLATDIRRRCLTPKP